MVPLTAPKARGPEAERALMERTRGRVHVLVGGVAAMLTVLGIRAGIVMAMADERIEGMRDIQYQSAVELTGTRGPLLDREGRLLAYTVKLPALRANPSNFPADKLDAKVPAIAALVGRSEAWVREMLTRPRAREVELGDGLDPGGAREVLAGLKSDQLWVTEKAIRLYPGKAVGAPLLGFVDSSGAGAAGLEKVLNRDLTGETYRLLEVRDRKGRSIQAGVDEDRLAQAGHGVRLTLDAAIQHETERALERAMIASAPEAAMAVVMDIRTGEILAMASLPSGNPNDGEVRAQQILFKNRPSMDQIEPGSVMKPFVVAAALEEGLVTPETLVNCELGSWVVGDRTIRDDHPKGSITVSEVIKYSSNIGAAKLGFKLGAERTLEYLKNFGFARSTGLGLPGDVAGQMRRLADIRPIELATTSFGQGITASPVQLVAAVATLANGGMRMSPRLVDAVLDRFGVEERVNEDRVDRRVVSEETARAVSVMMESVTEEGGTGTRARVPGYSVAGKTGTAQKVDGKGYSATARIGSFVGFLPASRPEVAIAVVIDTPTVGSKYGGIVAAPAFAEIGAFVMKYRGIAPDDVAVPESLAVAAPAGTDAAIVAGAPVSHPATATPRVERGPLELVADGAGAWILPDLAGSTMRASLAAIAPSGLKVEVEGNGRLVAQVPAPGAHLSPGEVVRLRFN